MHPDLYEYSFKSLIPFSINLDPDPNPVQTMKHTWYHMELDLKKNNVMLSELEHG
jgi:hypothetical protein